MLTANSTQFLIVFGYCLLGALLHFLASWTNGKARVSLYIYCFNHKKSTLTALIGVIVAALTVIATQDFDGGGKGIALAVLGGYFSDSAFNRVGALPSQEQFPEIN